MRILPVAIFIVCVTPAWTQHTISGRIIDSLALEPVAFASVTLEGGRTGSTSDIEGNFKLTVPSGYNGLVYFTHVTYAPVAHSLSFFDTKTIIRLSPSSTLLKEVVYVAEENPAFRIIRKVIRNKKENNPANLRSYQYNSYNKFLLTTSEASSAMDSIVEVLKSKPDTAITKKDKGFLSFSKMAESSYFFLSESVTQKKVINPDKQKETLMALKISGYKSPLFTNVATDYQPFSFYDNTISLLGKDYINPVSTGTFNRYDFQLVDTTFHNSDTVYIIRFQPEPNRFFNGLEGILSITTDGYAIRNVIASASDSLALTGIRIQQNYEKIDGHWFPDQLNTDIDFHEYKIYGRTLKARHRSFFNEIKINPDLDRREFGDITVDLAMPSEAQSNQLLEQFRPAPIEVKEARTYVLLDSVMKKMRWIDKTFETILSTRWALGAVDLDITQLLRFNRYEKVRTGIGLYTNDRFSKVFQPGGYVAYGFGDQKFKYGGEIRINGNASRNPWLRLSYRHDIYETGTSHFVRDGQFLGNESYRRWVAGRFDQITAYTAEVGMRVMQNVHATVTASRNEIKPTYDYALLLDNDPTNTFNIGEAGFTIRYGRKENYVNLRGHKILLSQEFPIIIATITKAVNLLNAPDFRYTRYDFTLKHTIRLKTLGRTSFTLNAGMVDGVAPLGKLYNGAGARSTDLFVDDHFQTMGLYEFTVSRFTALFFHHNFGNVFINKTHFKPELLVYHHMAIGTLSHAALHQHVKLQDMSDGYFESGAGLNNLIRINYFNIGYLGFGGSVFYRYGAYKLPDQNDNFIFRISAKFSF